MCSLPRPLGRLQFEHVFVGDYDSLVRLSSLRLAAVESSRAVDEYREAFRRFWLRSIVHAGAHTVHTRAPLAFTWQLSTTVTHTDVTPRFELVCATLAAALQASETRRATLLRECAALTECVHIRRHLPFERNVSSLVALTRSLADTVASVRSRAREPLVLWPPLYTALLAADEAKVLLAVDAPTAEVRAALGFVALARMRAATAIVPTLAPQRALASVAAWRRLSAALLECAGSAALAIACARVALDEQPADAESRTHLETLLVDNETSYHEDATLRRDAFTLVFERETPACVRVDGTRIRVGLALASFFTRQT